jgi:hypothetical protein
VLSQIDRLERARIRIREVANADEAFALALIPALALLALEIALRATWLRKLP